MKKSIIFKIASVVLSALIMCFAFAACGDDAAQPLAEHTKVKFEMEYDGEDIGSFVVEVYPEYAPITAANFVKLVEEGFYNGLTFHRIVEDFMAQGGAPKNETADTIKGEFAANGVDNPLADKHERGVISMARTNDYNSASSQFFICYSDTYSSALNGNYAAFGKVIEGMEVVDSFLDVPRSINMLGEAAEPVIDVIIKSATVVE